MTSPDPLRPTNISNSPELELPGTINPEMLNGLTAEHALATNLNEMMTSSDLPGPTELVSDVTSILNTPTKHGAINPNAPKLLSDVNMATCSPEMLNGSSAEINTRVRATNLNQTVDHSYLYVTCGTVMGKLHKDKFYCPGIHMQCIELDGGEMTTPRKMVTIADKERLKDWKTAVRVNGMPIRRFMERGLLDFHEHATTCTMKCLSRAGQPRDRESTSPLGMQTLTTSELADTMAPSLHLLQDSGPLSPDYESGESPPSPVPVKLVQVPLATTTSAVLIKPEYDYPAATSTPSNGGRTKRRRKQVPTSMVQLDESKLPKKRIGADFDAAELGLFQENEDCQVFWKGILRVGMLDQIVQDIVNEIQGLKKDLVMSGVGREEARQFSKIVKQLGMSQKIQNKVLSQKSTMQKEKEQLKKEMDELKRRVAAAEQRQYDLKRKAASLDQLMDFTLKRPALMTNFAFGVDSDSDNEHLQPAYANFVKNEVMEEGASSDTGSFTSHVEQDGDSPTQSNAELFLGPEPKRNRRKNANMLENVLKKLKENTS